MGHVGLKGGGVQGKGQILIHLIGHWRTGQLGTELDWRNQRRIALVDNRHLERNRDCCGPGGVIGSVFAPAGQ